MRGPSWRPIASCMRAAHAIGPDGAHLREGELCDVPWWSFSKLVMATSALKLVELGGLDLNAPVAGHPYTLRQLLQHEAGLPDYGWLESYHSSVARGEVPWHPDEIIARTFEVHPPSQPGLRWAYSNIGYYYVGELVRAAVGKKLGEALRALVLAPAGLNRARLAASKADLDSVQMGDAQGYDPGWVLPGLLVGPIEEAATFLHNLLSGKILDKMTLAEMLQVHLLPQFRDEIWEHPAYGLGIMGAWNGPTSACGHSGEGPGSGIAVYGCLNDADVKVAAIWESPGTSRGVERLTLGMLAQV